MAAVTPPPGVGTQTRTSAIVAPPSRVRGGRMFVVYEKSLELVRLVQKRVVPELRRRGDRELGRGPPDDAEVTSCQGPGAPPAADPFGRPARGRPGCRLVRLKSVRTRCPDVLSDSVNLTDSARPNLEQQYLCKSLSICDLRD